MIDDPNTISLDQPLEALEALLGGTNAVARAAGVAASTPSMWRQRGRRIPVEHCARLEAAGAGRVRRWHMRPDDWYLIWPELIGAEGAPPLPAKAAA